MSYTAVPKAKKGWGCFFQGVATIFIIILITIFATETESPAILHWGIGMAALYAIWGLDWTGKREVNSGQDTAKEEEEPPTLIK